jgi:hypothetical protein
MTFADSSPSLAGYPLGEQLYSSSKTLVYRATQTLGDNQRRSVVLKFLQQEYPTFHPLLQFRNQYTIAKNLDILGIVRPYRIDYRADFYALGVTLFELFTGQLPI